MCKVPTDDKVRRMNEFWKEVSVASSKTFNYLYESDRDVLNTQYSPSKIALNRIG